MTLYRRFAVMIAVSTVVMYALMYLNTFRLGDVLFSQTRVWMAILMGSVMAVIMLLFMRGMYTDARRNTAILTARVAVFAASLWLVRSQATVGDVAWMKAMIPHPSIAILTSSRAQLRDPRVRALAERIVAAQEREIQEMKAVIADLDAR